MSDAPIVRRDPFRSSAIWTDAPDVQFVWERTLNEVDESRIRRPQWKVTVQSGRRPKNGLVFWSALAVRHEQRISGSRCVVGELGAVVRPIELGHSFKIGRRLSTQRWYCPDADVGAA